MNKIKLSFIAIVFLFLWQSCDVLKEVVSFSKCEFRVTTLEKPRLAGIDISSKNKLSDFRLTDAAKLTQAFLAGRLPLTFTLNVEAKNPNPTTAAISRLDWIAYIDDVKVVEGTTDKRIVIPANNGVKEIPLYISTDLRDLLSGKSKDAVINFGLNLANASKKPTRVSLKVKPSVEVSGVMMTYPGYFTLNQEFSSN
jgi:hypothetical protein